MSEERNDQERPCLHCMIIELIDDFFAEYPATTGEADTIDTDEVIIAIAKTVAELTCSQDSTIRQQLIEQRGVSSRRRGRREQLSRLH